LIWVDIDCANADPITNKVAYLNLPLFETYCYDAYLKIKSAVENNTTPSICDNIYNHLLARRDGLGDGKALNDQYQSLLADSNIDLSLLRTTV
jgi:hypothetical protein